MEKRVLVVEDDRSLRPVLTRMIEKVNPDSVVEWATSAEDALELLKAAIRRGEKDSYDLIVSDIWLEGDRTGLDLLNACRQAELRTKVVLTSGKAAHVTSTPILRKPITFSSFEALVGPILGAKEGVDTPGKVIEVLYWLLILWVLAAVVLLGAARPTSWLSYMDAPIHVKLTIPVKLEPGPPVHLREQDRPAKGRGHVIPPPLDRLEQTPIRWHGIDPGFAVAKRFR